MVANTFCLSIPAFSSVLPSSIHFSSPYSHYFLPFHPILPNFPAFYSSLPFSPSPHRLSLFYLSGFLPTMLPSRPTFCSCLSLHLLFLAKLPTPLPIYFPPCLLFPLFLTYFLFYFPSCSFHFCFLSSFPIFVLILLSWFPFPYSLPFFPSCPPFLPIFLFFPFCPSNKHFPLG